MQYMIHKYKMKWKYKLKTTKMRLAVLSKRHILARKHVVWRTAKFCPLVRAQREPKNNFKKYTKKPVTCPTSSQRHMDLQVLKCGYTHDV